ncbi:MAG: F0F1 ATP synthase subunit gamma [Gammaproteobacteria bacterium]|nr:F0F1 ATP synthase subunit gamma [Gammaproteobacteria bacterium]MDE0714133.1 F0F1 ATP synthase subunit gamma [Gammaproteobacteria bacterium]MXX17740.1 F0F1 ATP synthase subunit gamma [Gammaproteobacteria bacterium]MXY63670.1 F0F1 ATP synthase subunit gamma [Gammaproteobacteria bacterium]MYG67031.1 F0F1 ATP synthase subunit gamma [Gammaproteobacteria bacterium]
MAGAKEIRNQIKSIGNTRKITKAMEMVAASKMRRAQERMHKARPYATRIRDVVAHAASANTEYHHPYLEARDEVRHAGYIVVSSDRGLCGGLNSNLFRKVVADMGEKSGQGVEISVCVIGKKASAFFKRHGANVVSEVTDLGDSPHVEKLIGALKVMMDGYIGGDIDRLFVVYNDFVNTMIQRPTIEQLIPIVPSRDEETQHHWDYIYEPEAKPVVDTLMDRYIESLVYQAVADNNACEQAARMVAMKAATDNAGKLIDELRLVYNKARQAAITQELSEIVGGAAAV